MPVMPITEPRGRVWQGAPARKATSASPVASTPAWVITPPKEP